MKKNLNIILFILYLFNFTVVKLRPTHTKTQNRDINFYVLDVETWGLNPQPEFLAFGVIYGKDTEYL